MQYRQTAAAVVACSVVLALAALLNCGVDRLVERDSVAQLIQAADTRGYANSRVGMLYNIDHTAQFYASGRLLYGSDSDPAKFVGTAEMLKAVRENNGSLLILAPIDQLNQLTSLNEATTDVIASNGRTAIVAVRLK